MSNKKSTTQNPIAEVLNHPKEVMEEIMRINADNANRIYNLCKEMRMLDSQEFLDWQDELNEISVKYDMT